MITITAETLLELLATAATVGRNEGQDCTTRGELAELAQARMSKQIAALNDGQPVDPAAALLAMLDQRERTARESYDEIGRHIRENDAAEVPGWSAEERAQALRDWREASARWTEAQEALTVARALVSQGSQ